jgi:hypothetical protein
VTSGSLQLTPQTKQASLVEACPLTTRFF